MVDALGPNEIEKIDLIDRGVIEEEILRINQWLTEGNYKKFGKSTGWIILADHLTHLDYEEILKRFQDKWGKNVHLRELTLWDKLPNEQKIIAAICFAGLPFLIDAIIRSLDLENGQKKQYILEFR